MLKHSRNGKERDFGMNEVSSEDRELAREKMASVAEFLHIECDYPIKVVKRLIREITETDY